MTNPEERHTVSNEPTTQATPRPGLPTNAGNDELLDHLQRITFDYFLNEVNPENGLIADSTRDRSAASIAAVGFALTIYPVAVERGLLSRAEAAARTLTTLRFFLQSPMASTAPLIPPIQVKEPMAGRSSWAGSRPGIWGLIRGRSF